MVSNRGYTSSESGVGSGKNLIFIWIIKFIFRSFDTRTTLALLWWPMHGETLNTNNKMWLLICSYSSMDRSMFPAWIRPSIEMFDPAERLFDVMNRFFVDRGVLISRSGSRKHLQPSSSTKMILPAKRTTAARMSTEEKHFIEYFTQSAAPKKCQTLNVVDVEKRRRFLSPKKTNDEHTNEFDFLVGFYLIDERRPRSSFSLITSKHRNTLTRSIEMLNCRRCRLLPRPLNRILCKHRNRNSAQLRQLKSEKLN